MKSTVICTTLYEQSDWEQWQIQDLQTGGKDEAPQSAEIAFTDSRKRRSVVSPSPLPDIARVQSLKVLGVTISNSLSLSEHVNSVISSCACSQYAIKVLRAHGLCDTASQEVYKSVVVGKLLYASPLTCGNQISTGEE